MNMDWKKFLLKMRQKRSKINEYKDILKFSGNAKSQSGQDIFVLSETGFKRNGFFVEFGATNGIDLSNTFLLEKMFNWNGILAEPAKIWHPELSKNRSCAIEFDCVWSCTGERLSFIETREGTLSTIRSFENSDGRNRLSKQTPNSYDVRTISLLDLLRKHNSPPIVDYLSIDTEGSEYEILKNHDFSDYLIKLITVEHNYTSSRDLIFDLLTDKGYVRKFEGLSGADDWYVKES